MGDVVQRVAARGLRDARGEDERGVHQAGLDDDARRAREARPAARERDEPRALGVDAADAPDDEACGLAERCLARRRGGRTCGKQVRGERRGEERGDQVRERGGGDGVAGVERRCQPDDHPRDCCVRQPEHGGESDELALPGEYYITTVNLSRWSYQNLDYESQRKPRRTSIPSPIKAII